MLVLVIIKTYSLFLSNDVIENQLILPDANLIYMS